MVFTPDELKNQINAKSIGDNYIDIAIKIPQVIRVPTDQIIETLIQDQGYVVMKKAELESKLKSILK